MKRYFRYILIYFFISFFISFFPKYLNAQILDNSCPVISPKEVDNIIYGLNNKLFSITELSKCQSKSYSLFTRLIKINAKYFKYADRSIKGDEMFIRTFIKSYPNILNYITFSLKSDPIFFKSLAKIYDKALEYASYDLVDNRLFMKNVIDIKPINYKYASARLQNDKELTLFAVKKDGRMLRYASIEMRRDKEIVLEAIKSYSLSVSYASRVVKNDEEIEEIIKKYNYSYLIGIESYLMNNYGGIEVGPRGSRGYRIVNQSLFLGKKPLIERKEFFKWKNVLEKDKHKIPELTTGKLKNLKWELDLEDYPKLKNKISNILLKRLDNNTAQSMTLTSLWEVSNKPRVFVFKLYILRHVENLYDDSKLNNTSYLVGVAYEKDKEEEEPKRNEEKDKEESNENDEEFKEDEEKIEENTPEDISDINQENNEENVDSEEEAKEKEEDTEAEDEEENIEEIENIDENFEEDVVTQDLEESIVSNLPNVEEDKSSEENEEETQELEEELDNIESTQADISSSGGNIFDAAKNTINSVTENVKLKLFKEQKTYQKEGEWIITIVDSNMDIDFQNDILLQNSHKDYEFWDIVKNEEDNYSNLIFRVKDINSEYFEILSKQENDLYKPIYKGGGYSFE